mmetsp:Transcript_52073/g.151311  ORF Transcript_52073/g.151311 Transcript_52073/m.151311 type:complete len:414 (-) Transcript_52073:420-1661(-)
MVSRHAIRDTRPLRSASNRLTTGRVAGSLRTVGAGAAEITPAPCGAVRRLVLHAGDGRLEGEEPLRRGEPAGEGAVDAEEPVKRAGHVANGSGQLEEVSQGKVFPEVGGSENEEGHEELHEAVGSGEEGQALCQHHLAPLHELDALELLPQARLLGRLGAVERHALRLVPHVQGRAPEVRLVSLLCKAVVDHRPADQVRREAADCRINEGKVQQPAREAHNAKRLFRLQPKQYRNEDHEVADRVEKLRHDAEGVIHEQVDVLLQTLLRVVHALVPARALVQLDEEVRVAGQPLRHELAGHELAPVNVQPGLDVALVHAVHHPPAHQHHVHAHQLGEPGCVGLVEQVPPLLLPSVVHEAEEQSKEAHDDNRHHAPPPLRAAGVVEVRPHELRHAREHPPQRRMPRLPYCGQRSA